MPHTRTLFRHPAADTVAGVVVFLVAVPLCLGIAVASGFPPVSGLVAGVVGGLMVPLLSRSPLSVTGPAAGLTAILLAQQARLGGIPPLLAAITVAGGMQLVLGALRGGRLADLVPSSVVRGMLAAIGVTIVLKELPVAAGVTAGGWSAVAHPHPGPLLVSAVTMAVLVAWPRTPLGGIRVFPPALAGVLAGSLVAAWLGPHGAWGVADAHFVRLPAGGVDAVRAALPVPEWGAVRSAAVWEAAALIAAVASLESLLSLQAIDRLDPLRRHSPPNRELLAQGAANILSGALGGLPVTAVIVRGATNVAAGGRERLAALVHGVLLLLALTALGPLLRHIPLAALAAVVIQVGARLIAPSMVRRQWRLGATQFLPFAITVATVLALDLVLGVLLGLVAGIGFVLYENGQRVLVATRDADGVLRLRFRRDGTFLAKPGIVAVLDGVADGERVVIDGTGGYIDHDVKEAIAAFVADAPHRALTVRVEGIDLAHAQGGGAH